MIEPARTPGRWARAGGRLLMLAVAGATVGVLAVAFHTSVLLGRMTTEVVASQTRATTLANTQRQALLLLREVTATETGSGTTGVGTQQGLLSRQLRVSWAIFPAESAPARELRELHRAVGGFPWERLDEPGAGTLRESATALVSYVDLQVKKLYSDQETYFYQATLDSLDAKRQGRDALTGLVLLVVLLAACWAVLLKRRTRTDLARANEQLRHQAYHDALTGLPNRTLVMARLAEAVARGDGPVTAVLIDLDGFKNVNDTLGHHGGDALLRQVAARLRECVRDGDTVARLGGDEFAVVLPDAVAADGAAVARRVLAALRRPIAVGGQETRIGASIGIAELDGHIGPDDLLADADIAMYAAKRAGKGRLTLFEPEMRERALARSRIEQQLARAVALGQVEVHYQPIVDLVGRSVVAVEALARWRLSPEEVIGPAAFIPVAEETGLIVEIGAEVLRTACRTVRDWRATVPGAADLGLTVNVSGLQLLAGDFSLQVADALARTGLPAEALTLEITESVLLEDSDTLAAELARIKTLGVRLAMDDFGAGYSSLSSLRRFPVDTLKIDRMFLDLGAGDPAPLVRAVAELGRSLGLTVVAEGVETVEQLALVRAAHCDAAQGFLLSRPLAEADARLFLEWAASSDEIAALMAPRVAP
jgi:diguanylate cyclase (GGDEF)-like protein